MFAFRFLLFTCLLSCSYLYGQSGCTDPCATNYDPLAINDDGSCTYALTLESTLPAALLEASGMVFTDNVLWMHPDGGGGNAFFRVDTTTWTIDKTVVIRNASNNGSGSVTTLEDWEDMTASQDYIFMGDVGNNNGNRENLKILRVAKADLTANATDSVIADTLAFTYSDQGTPPFSSAPQNNDFDCEAIIHHSGAIHLFTKNWVDNQVKHYSLPDQPGTHVAQLQATYNVNGLITGAGLAPNGAIALIGNNTNIANPRVIMYYLHSYAGTQFFTGQIRAMDLGATLSLGQVEGVTFATASRLFASSEQVSVVLPPIFIPQRSYGLNLCPPVPLSHHELVLKLEQSDREYTLAWDHPQGLDLASWAVEWQGSGGIWERQDLLEADQPSYNYQGSLPEQSQGKIRFRVLGFDYQGNQQIAAFQEIYLHEKSQWLSLAPNPAQDWIAVRADREARIYLLDQTGRQVSIAQFVEGERKVLSLSELAPGYYQIKAVDERGDCSYRGFIRLP